MSRCWPWSHKWNRWLDAEHIITRIYIGYDFPAEVRGKEFKTKKHIRIRECSACGKKAKRKM